VSHDLDICQEPDLPQALSKKKSFHEFALFFSVPLR
jgi:hypothetical protein